jgi:hypothetical protein
LSWSCLAEFFILKSGYVGELSVANVCRLVTTIKSEIVNIGDMWVGREVHLATRSLNI